MSHLLEKELRLRCRRVSGHELLRRLQAAEGVLGKALLLYARKVRGFD
jgi:hypothetical protein